MTDFEMDKLYTITGRELLALLSLIPDGDEKAKAILDNVAGREKSGKVNEGQIDFLKPCPFCGSTDVHLVDNDPGKSEVSITCKDCNVWVDHMFDAMSNEEAIALWNRRVSK
jgi:Lar family restriction alleviation protein